MKSMEMNYLLALGVLLGGSVCAVQASEDFTIQIIDDIPQNPNRPGAGKMGRTWEERVPYTIEKISNMVFGGNYNKNILLTDDTNWALWKQLVDALNIQIVNEQLRPYAQRLQKVIQDQFIGIIPRFIADLSSSKSPDKSTFVVANLSPRTMDTLKAIMSHDLQKDIHTELASIKRAVNGLRFTDSSSEKQRIDMMNAIGTVDGIIATFESNFNRLWNEYSRVHRVLDYPRPGVKSV